MHVVQWCQVYHLFCHFSQCHINPGHLGNDALKIHSCYFMIISWIDYSVLCVLTSIWTLIMSLSLACPCCVQIYFFYSFIVQSEMIYAYQRIFCIRKGFVIFWCNKSENSSHFDHSIPPQSEQLAQECHQHFTVPWQPQNWIIEVRVQRFSMCCRHEVIACLLHSWHNTTKWVLFRFTKLFYLSWDIFCLYGYVKD